MSNSDLRAFEAFIEEATPLVEIAGPEAGEYLEAFEQFARESRHILLDRANRRLPALLRRIQKIQRWLPEHDLLDLARLYLEDAYTDLIAWVLDPATHEESALRWQKAWLTWLRIPTDSLRRAAKPKTQLRTDDGIPDLVLRYKKLLVVIEAKTDSKEGRAPSGKWQTEAYPEATRRHYDLPASFETHMVFLTRSGDPPMSENAIATTHLDFVLAMAEADDPEALPQEVQIGMGMILRNLLSSLAPDHMDVVALIENFMDRLPGDTEQLPITLLDTFTELDNVLSRKAQS